MTDDLADLGRRIGDDLRDEGFLWWGMKVRDMAKKLEAVDPLVLDAVRALQETEAETLPRRRANRRIVKQLREWRSAEDDEEGDA